eukprot:3976685-Pyramimonas_sp.AAC.2
MGHMPAARPNRARGWGIYLIHKHREREDVSRGGGVASHCDQLRRHASATAWMLRGCYMPVFADVTCDGCVTCLFSRMLRGVLRELPERNVTRASRLGARGYTTTPREPRRARPNLRSRVGANRVRAESIYPE